MVRRWLQLLALRFCLVVGIFLPMAVTAAPLLTLAVTQANQAGAAGTSLSFSGVITNRTGQTLAATDLFLSFSGYDFDALNPIQLLGNMPFNLAHNTFSGDLPLFSIELSSTALAGHYGFEVVLQDVTGNFSQTTGIDIEVRDSKVVPEPSGIGLLAMAGFAALLTRRRTPSAAASALNVS